MQAYTHIRILSFHFARVFNIYNLIIDHQAVPLLFVSRQYFDLRLLLLYRHITLIFYDYCCHIAIPSRSPHNSSLP